MRPFLRKRWFLLLLILGGVWVGLWPGGLRWTAAVDPRFVMAPALGLMALGLDSRSLYRTLRRPLPALWGVVVCYGVLPVLAWALGPLLPGQDLRLGLLIMASVPCTLASALLWTRMAGGNEATALLIILLTTGTSWLVTTGWLALLAGTTVVLDRGALMRGLFLTLVLPFGLGQLLRAAGPCARAADRYRTPLGVVSRLLIFLVILKAAADVRDRLVTPSGGLTAGSLLLAAAVCLGVHLAAMAVGLWGGKALAFSRPDQLAVAIAGSQKTLPVALFLFDAYFRDYPLAVVPMVFYHVGQLVLDTFIAEGLAGRAVKGLPAAVVVD